MTDRTDNTPQTTQEERGEHGVLHCWIVDPDGKSVECYRLESGGYRLVAEGEGDTKLGHPDWEGFVIDLAGLFSLAPFS